MVHSIQDIEDWFGKALPAAYHAFLEGNPNNVGVSDLVLLYGRESSVERNETYETKKNWAGFVTIGNDSGDMEFILSLDGGPVLMIDGGSSKVESAEHVADDFPQWLAAGCPIPEYEPVGFWPVDPMTKVCIYLESPPANLKNLLIIKKRLGISTSIGALKHSLDAIPCLIADGFVYAGARVCCCEINTLDPCLGIRLASNTSVRIPLEDNE